ncbi:hypothetical protein Ancab_021903 [Ancistrocladus abbreviatus]
MHGPTCYSPGPEGVGSERRVSNIGLQPRGAAAGPKETLLLLGLGPDKQRMRNRMPFRPTKSMWGALLAGGRAHKDLEFGEFAAWKLVELEPENSAHYVVLSNMYADMGRWSDVFKVRDLMKERGLKKDLALSLVEYENIRALCIRE